MTGASPVNNTSLTHRWVKWGAGGKRFPINFETQPVSPTGQPAQQDAVGGIIVLSTLVYVGFQAEVEVLGHA